MSSRIDKIEVRTSYFSHISIIIGPLNYDMLLLLPDLTCAPSMALYSRRDREWYRWMGREFAGRSDSWIYQSQSWRTLYICLRDSIISRLRKVSLLESATTVARLFYRMRSKPQSIKTILTYSSRNIGHTEAVEGASLALRETFLGWDGDKIQDIWQHAYRSRFYRGGPVLMVCTIIANSCFLPLN